MDAVSLNPTRIQIRIRQIGYAISLDLRGSDSVPISVTEIRPGSRKFGFVETSAITTRTRGQEEHCRETGSDGDCEVGRCVRSVASSRSS